MGAVGLDPSVYTSHDVFTAERDRLFARSWVPVCRAEDVANPGDYVAYDLAGDPIVVARTADGELAALANVCRHRNMVLVEGSGNAAAFRCPYHHWTYRLDGSLAAAPHGAAIDGFDPDVFCLPRLAVETWHGFVLVNGALDAAPFASQVGGLDPYLAEFDAGSMVRVGAITWDQPWNWKLTVENYCESYHHQGVHGQTLQQAFPGEASRPVTGGDEPWMVLEHEVAHPDIEPLLVAAAYPMLLPAFAGPDEMVWLKLEVHGPTRSTLTTEVLMPPDRAGDTEAAARHLEGIRTINTEDEVPNRGVAAGMASRYAVAATLHPLEAGVAHFNRWYAEAMAGG